MASRILTRLLILLSSLLLIPVARAEGSHLLVVLPLDGSAAQLDRPTRELFEETIRTVAGDSLRPYGFTVLTNDTTIAVLKDNGVNPEKVCESECALEAARELKAEFFISGKITTLEGSLVAIIRLSEPRAGQQLSSLQIEAPNMRQLRATLNQRLPELLLPLHRVMPRAKATATEGRIEAAPSARFEDAPEEGLVTFESTPPGSTIVRLDNELLCQKTPCSKAVVLGPHTVTMERERYFAVTRTVTLERDSRVQIALDPNFGTLTINTIPSGLALSLNGKSVGTSPVSNLELDPDVYPVIIDDKCFLPEGNRVLIERGKHRELNLAGKAREAKIKVNATDKEGNDFKASVSVDGREVGTTPGTFTVPVCSESLVVRNERGQEWRDMLDLAEGKTTPIKADFGKPNLTPSRLSSSRRSLPAGATKETPPASKPAWAIWTTAIGGVTWAGMGIGALVVHSQLKDLPLHDASIAGKQSTGKALMVLSNVGAGAVVVGVIGLLAARSSP